MLRLWKTFKTNLIVTPIIRLTYKLKRFIFKKATKLTLLVLQNIKDRIRLLVPEAHLEGYDKKFDMLVHLASLKLTDPIIFEDDSSRFLLEDTRDAEKYPELKEQFSKLEKTNAELKKLHSDRRSEYLENMTEVGNLTGKAQNDKDIIKLVERYNLIHHYIANYLKKKEEADYYLSKARKINPTASPLKTKDISNLNSSLRNDIKKVREIISDRHAIKLSLSLKNAGTLIPVVSTVFLFSGYIYNWFLLGEFGIEVSKYFTLSDYIASSIESIRYSASGAAIGIVFLFLSVHSASRKSFVQLEFEWKIIKYFSYILLLSAIISAIHAYINNLENFYNIFSIAIFLCIMLLAPWVAKRYFKEPLVALFVIVFLFTFSVHMFVSLGKTIHHLKYKKLEEMKNYDIIFREQIPLESSKLVLIAGNSNYLFFLDKDKNTFVIPRDQVLYVVKKAPDKKPNK